MQIVRCCHKFHLALKAIIRKSYRTVRCISLRKNHLIGIIGCGTISQTYLKNLTSKFSILEVIGVSDIIPERSKAKAEAFGVRQMTNEEIYACDEIEVVVNLTNPVSLN